MTHLVQAGSPDNRFKSHGIVLVPYEVRGPSSDDEPDGPLLEILWAVNDGSNLWGEGPLTTELSALQYALKIQSDMDRKEIDHLVDAKKDAILTELVIDEEVWKAKRLAQWLRESQAEHEPKARGTGMGP